MNLFGNKMPPNVALAPCIVVGIPAVVDCLTAGIIFACGKAPKKSSGGSTSLGTKSRRPPLLWFGFY